MKIKITFNKRGFTLIEHLFSVIILGFMLTICLSTFVGIFRFYTWSSTTRTTQSTARQAMDIISRDVSSGSLNISASTSSEICIKNSTSTSEKISVNTNKQLQKQTFSTDDCTPIVGPLGGPTTQVLTPIGVNVTSLNLEYVTTASNTSYANNYRYSAVINIVITNGIADNLGNCLATNIFCDKASFSTVSSEGVRSL